MECYLILALPILQLLLTLHHINPCIAASSCRTNTSYINTSCNLTSYPKLCYTSLSIYAEEVKTDPKALAHTALNVTLAATQEAYVVIDRCSRFDALRPIETAPMLDCVEVVSNALDELQQSVDELDHVVEGSRKFSSQMSDLRTWVSAALTDEDTCLEGFDELHLNGRVATIVRRAIVNVSHLTSISLALINNYAST